MGIKKLAAVNIGSNEVRLFISNVLEEAGENPKFTKANLVCMPICLGADVFIDGFISPESADRLVDVIEVFRLLMKVNQVKAHRACATSAMCETINGQVVTDGVLKRIGIRTDIISGSEEAETITSTDVSNFIKNDKNYLYIDIGGGSTEFTIFSNGRTKKPRSFPIGTVCLLDNKMSDKAWKEVQEWIEKHTTDCQPIEAIGSGSNINKVHRNPNNHEGDPLTYEYLTDYHTYVPGYTYDERTRLLGFNLDRVDVILYALAVFIDAMRWSKAPIVHVPRVGLADGIVRAIYNKESR